MLNFSENFVCATREFSTFQKHVPSPVFRKSFSIDSEVKSSEILICGLGFYDLYINGKKITKGLIAPYISNPDDIMYYDLYDLKKYLKIGENVIGVICGNGFNNPMTKTWDFDTALFTSSPKLALSFLAITENGEVSFDVTDFKCTESEIIFDNLRTGAFVDARKAEKGRFECGFDDNNWRSVLRAEKPRGIPKLCECEPVTVCEQRSPVSIKAGELVDTLEKIRKETPDYEIQTEFSPTETVGGYIFDFGVNDSGIFRLKINGNPGQVISIQTAEIMTDGKVDHSNLELFYFPGYCQRDIYICSGNGEEVFEPPFTYHGYRYAYVTGITKEQAVPETLTYLVAHSDIKRLADFNCSDKVANTLYEMCERSDVSNLNYFPTDSPHREKNGWTGDASFSSEHMTLTLGVDKIYREWLNNVRLAQNEVGMLPGIVPTATKRGWGYKWGNGPAWDSVLFNLPWILYVYRGNTDTIIENAHAMMSYLEYISKMRNSHGLVDIGLGDWAPMGQKTIYAYKTPIAVTDTIMVFDMANKAEIMFNRVGLTLNASYAKALKEEVKAAFHRELLDTNSMLVDGCTITGQSAAIYYDILEPGEKQAAFNQMLKMFKAKDKCLDFGMIGLRAAFHVLSDFGESELAYRIITRSEFPSYGCLVERGETTINEQIIEAGKDCGSHNHHFLGDIKHWFLRQIVGINVNPSHSDASTVVIRPHFIKSLDYASGYHILPSGKVSVDWKRISEDTVKLSLKYDAGVKTHISLTPDCYIIEGYNMFDGKYPSLSAGGNFEITIKIDCHN